MAKKKKPSTKRNNSSNSDFFSISAEKKKKIAGVGLLFFALLLFLSIVSYSAGDEDFLNYNFFEIMPVFGSSGGDVQPNNWLGIIGVYLAHLCIHSTIGFFSVIFPVIIGMWGYYFLTTTDRGFIISVTNFLVIMGLLAASFFGVIRQEIESISSKVELSGDFGAFIGKFLTGLIGAAGGIILILAAVIVLLVIAFDIKIEKIFEFMKDKSSDFAEKQREKKRMREQEEKNTVSDEVEPEKDIKPAGKEKKKPDKELNDPIEESNIPEKEETQININRTDRARRKKEEDEIEDAQILEETERTDTQQVEPPLLIQKEKESAAQEQEDVPETERSIEAELPEPWEEEITYNQLTVDILEPVPYEDEKVADEELSRNAQLLKEKLALFDIEIKKISVTPGPVVTLYEIVPAPGVKISKIVSLEHDIALALAARGIRIIAPIPGKSAIGVEIPNAKPSQVVASQVLAELSGSNAQLPLALGKTINGDVKIADLAGMPHLLIAGSTGSGKSVGINMMITSILFAKHPSEIKFAIIDPKKIELSFYNKLRHHFLAICPDLDEDIVTIPTNAVLLLKSVESEMEKRYDMLAKAGVRNIVDYNKKLESPITKLKDTEKVKHHFMPYIVVIIDELADLMITAGKEVEEPIARLAQMARAVGIHLVVATQRPSVNVITGLIKANFSARIAYQVATKIDSRTILDMNGAEQLLGKGDMLFLPGGSPKPERIQNAFISTDEVERITEFVDKQKGFSKPYYLPSIYEKKGVGSASMLDDLDDMFEDAAYMVVRTQQGSISMLQRKLKLGYSRAARIVDQLEEAGIVAANDGSKAREVLVASEDELRIIIDNL